MTGAVSAQGRTAPVVQMVMSNAAHRDVFHEIAERDAAKAKADEMSAYKAFWKNHSWSVLRGNGKNCRHRFTYNKARKVAARFNRLFKTDIAYATR